jgi:hypothetical protein
MLGHVEKQVVYQLFDVSAVSWYQEPNSDTWLFVSVRARVKRTVSKFQNPIRTARQPPCCMSSCKWLFGDNAIAILRTKCCHKIQVYNVIHGIARVFSAHHESIWMTTVMPNSSIYPTAYLSTQTASTLLSYWKLFVVCQENWWEQSG